MKARLLALAKRKATWAALLAIAGAAGVTINPELQALLMQILPELLAAIAG